MQLINRIQSVGNRAKDFLRNNLFKRASGDTWSNFVVPKNKMSVDQVYDNLHVRWTNKHKKKLTSNNLLSVEDSKEFNLWLQKATPTAIANSGVNIFKPVAGDNDRIFEAFVSLL